MEPLVSTLRPPKGSSDAIPGTAARTGGRRSRSAELLGLAAIFAQVALVVLIIRVVGLETLGFRRAIYVAAAAFVVHHLLPFRLRLPFFVITSLVGMVVILGGIIDARIPDLGLGLLRTGTILAIGAILIAICHLPVGLGLRVGLLLIAGTLIAMFRAQFWPSGVLAIVWTVLATMFMFRVMVYLYDLSTSQRRPSKSQSLAYFFLLPNVCTLLFPVVDFRTFCQKYYDEDALAIYQRGVKWMVRGVVHLLLYRVVDRVATLEASAVANGTDLIQFVVSNLFLYLKVSGSFHLVIGLLLLFGFNLPETNHRYFLASSFTDYWRRVNIYWRSFVMKVFYYPAFFRFKSMGQVKALVLATCWSFFATWALHSYQTWWIKGAVSWTWPDTLFWAILAVLVLVNSLWELKRNRPRKLVTGRYSAREAFGLAVRTATTFAIIGVLWSLWSTPSLEQWLHIWRLADLNTLAWGGVVLACVMLATILFEVLPARWNQPAAVANDYARTPHFRWAIVQCTVPLVAIYFVTHPRVQSWLDAPDVPRLADARAMVQILRENSYLEQGQGQGYYENLTASDRGTSQYAETMNPGRGHSFSQPTHKVDNIASYQLAPNVHFEDRGWRFTTNRWGMRDGDYELTKPSGTLRMAMLGSSHLMGFGLSEKDMFEPAIEARLNAERRHGGHFEIMNFGVGGISPLGQVFLLQDRMPRFRPDIIVYIAHPNDFEWSIRDVVRSLRKQISFPDDFLSQILTAARVNGRTNEVFGIQRLRPHASAILSKCYEQIVSRCRSIDASPVYIFLPVPEDIPLDATRAATQLRLAQDAGFLVIDLSDVYAGHNLKELTLKDHGHHSNATANAIIATALYDRLTTDPRIDLLNRARPGS